MFMFTWSCYVTESPRTGPGSWEDFFTSGGFSYMYISENADEGYRDLWIPGSPLKEAFFYFALQFSLPHGPKFSKMPSLRRPWVPGEPRLYSAASVKQGAGTDMMCSSSKGLLSGIPALHCLFLASSNNSHFIDFFLHCLRCKGKAIACSVSWPSPSLISI